MVNWVRIFILFDDMPNNLKLTLFFSLLLSCSSSFAQDSLQKRNLEYYLTMGIINSPLLKDNINAVEMNRLDSLLNIAMNKPFVQSVGQYLYAPGSNNWGYDENITNGGQYTGLLQVSRNLLYRKNVKIHNQLNSALKDSLMNTIRINQNDLRKAIIDIYLISFQDYRQMIIFQDLFKILSEQNNILKELLKSAFFTQADYLAFRVDLQQSEINWQASKVQYLQDLLALNILCNINDTTLVNLENPRLSQTPVFSFDNNPYLLRYRFDSLIVEKNRRVIDIYYRPKLNLTADGGINAVKYGNIPKNYGYSMFLDFSIPIYNGKQRKYQYQKLNVQQRTIWNYRNQYITRLTLKLKTINEQIRVNQALLLLIEKQNTDIENLLKLSKARLYSGDMSAIDYLLIIQRYLNIKININQLTIQRMRLISEFNYRNW
ncbi:MAG TPA: TolC family protein [Cytophagaceae bacterium]|nr:TolC family protein [Cytophagaceae bacterium]